MANPRNRSDVSGVAPTGGSMGRRGRSDGGRGMSVELPGVARAAAGCLRRALRDPPPCVAPRHVPAAHADNPASVPAGSVSSVLVVERGRCARGSPADMDAGKTGQGGPERRVPHFRREEQRDPVRGWLLVLDRAATRPATTSGRDVLVSLRPRGGRRRRSPERGTDGAVGGGERNPLAPRYWSGACRCALSRRRMAVFR